MKASVLHSIGDLRYEEIDIPKLKEDEVLVHVQVSGICGSDVNRVLKNGTYHFPTVIGHEFSGVVVSVENSKYNKWIGKRVGIFPLKPCFKCNNCLNGTYEMCSNYDYLGSRCNGGFEEYVAVPVWNLIELPEEVSFEEAAMLEPVSVGVHALRRFGEIKNKSIAIIGPGPIGNILCQLAQINGASRVILIGRTQQKLEFAKTNFSVDIINSSNIDLLEEIQRITGNSGVDLVLEGTGAEQSLTNAISIVKSGGKIVLMGNPTDNIHLLQQIYWQILRKQLCLIGTWNSSFGMPKDDWTYALELIATGKLKLLPIISHKLQFSQLLDGIHIMRDSSQFSSKILLINDEKEC